MTFDLVTTTIEEVAALFDDHHAYGSTGDLATYAFAVVEAGEPVAAFLWQPPAPGAALSVCPALPVGVLALSRMVAVPRDQRWLSHISKPLRRQMRQRIDRTRWPVLVTYSDESVGHTGYVYKCSGWKPTKLSRARTWTLDGRRVSSYTRGSNRVPEGAVAGWAWIQRWEHWAKGDIVDTFVRRWRKVATGRVWRSGRPAYRYEPVTPTP